MLSFEAAIDLGDVMVVVADAVVNAGARLARHIIAVVAGVFVARHGVGSVVEARMAVMTGMLAVRAGFVMLGMFHVRRSCVFEFVLGFVGRVEFLADRLRHPAIPTWRMSRNRHEFRLLGGFAGHGPSASAS